MVIIGGLIMRLKRINSELYWIVSASLINNSIGNRGGK